MSRKTAEPEVLDPANAVGALQHEASAHALAVNKALGVTEYNLDAALAKLRGLMATASQTMLEMGETLILMHEHETAEVFHSILGRAGLEDRTARRMMQAARKFRLSLTKPQQAALQDLSRGTLLELLVLDDEDVAELANGGTVLGLELDDVATMPTSKLRLELRKARAVEKEKAKTTDRQITDKNDKITQLEAQLDKYAYGTRDEQARLAVERETNAAEAMQAAALELLGAVQRFAVAIADCQADSSPARRTLAESATNWTFQRIAQIALDNEIPVDFQSVVNPFGELEA